MEATNTYLGQEKGLGDEGLAIYNIIQSDERIVAIKTSIRLLFQLQQERYKELYKLHGWEYPDPLPIPFQDAHIPNERIHQDEGNQLDDKWENFKRSFEPVKKEFDRILNEYGVKDGIRLERIDDKSYQLINWDLFRITL